MKTTQALLVALLLASTVAFSAAEGCGSGDCECPNEKSCTNQEECVWHIATCIVNSQAEETDEGFDTAAAGNDPVFDGFDGSRYYVKCEANKTYALLSVPGTQVNIYTTTGLEEDADILWITSIGFKVGDFALTLKMPKDSSYYAGEPSYEIITNDEDTTDRLHSAQEYTYSDGDVRVYYFEQELQWQEEGTDQDGNHGLITGVPLIDVFTPQFKFQVHMVTETRASGKHLASPRFDIVSTILAPVEPAMAAGLLGESMSWNGSAPFMRGYLAGPDSAYEVDGLLEHGYKFDSDKYTNSHDGQQGVPYGGGQYGGQLNLARDVSRPSTKRALAAGLPAHDGSVQLAMSMVGRSAGTGLLMHR